MKRLNKEQYAASEGTGGITLVIAGAGTGKTTTMIEKTANCIEKGITTPGKILIMTFSKKAAGEIRERVERKSSSLKGIGFAGTFHSFSLNLLKHYSHEYMAMRGSSAFPAIIDDGLKSELMRKTVMADLSRFLGMPCDAVLGISENIDRLDPYMERKLKRSDLYSEIIKVPREYQNYKLKENLIDYEDMINDASLLLEKNESVKKDIHDRFNYIFVDEFQDSSENNMRLLRLLLPDKNANLYMVGDDYQSIYKFRRAEVQYIINVRNYFPGADIHKLTVNYRSRKEIVLLSNRFIRLNRFRTDKKIKSFRGSGGRVRFHSAGNAHDECGIIRNILISRDSTGETAILFRNNYQGEIIQKQLGGEFNDDVELMTMHGSKGLEFNIVIIAGIADRIIPDRASDIEEERRLFYVAMTRAKDELHIIYYRDSRGRLPQFVRELGVTEE